MTYYAIEEFNPMFCGGILIPSYYEQFIQILRDKTRPHRCMKKIEEHIREGHLACCMILTSHNTVSLLFSNPPLYTARNYTLHLIV